MYQSKFTLLFALSLSVVCFSLAAQAPKIIKVVTVIQEPLVSRNQTTGQYGGFLIDILDELSRVLSFQYDIYESPENSRGRFDKDTATWTGVMGELTNKRADMAVTDLTITSRRLEHIDYGLPIMPAGIHLIHRKSLAGHLSSKAENVVLMKNQTARDYDDFEVSLKATAYRKYSSMSKILENPDIEFDCSPGGATEHFLRTGNTPNTRKAWTRISENQNRTRSTREGIKKVMNSNGNYAFFMETPIMERMLAHDGCLYEVGHRLIERYISFGTQKDSPYTALISAGIMTLQENGFIENLRQQYWPANDIAVQTC